MWPRVSIPFHSLAALSKRTTAENTMISVRPSAASTSGGSQKLWRRSRSIGGAEATEGEAESARGVDTEGGGRELARSGRSSSRSVRTAPDGRGFRPANWTRRPWLSSIDPRSRLSRAGPVHVYALRHAFARSCTCGRPAPEQRSSRGGSAWPTEERSRAGQGQEEYGGPASAARRLGLKFANRRGQTS